MSDRADKMKMVAKLSTLSGTLIFFFFKKKYRNLLLKKFSIVDKSASKIQAAFRKHQARLKLKKQAAWQIHEKLEYCSEQTEAKVRHYQSIQIDYDFLL